MGSDGFDELRSALRGDAAAEAKGPTVGLRHALTGAGAAVVLAAAVLAFTVTRPTGEAPPRLATPLDAVGGTAPTNAAPALPAPATGTRVWPSEPVEIVGNEVRTGGHAWIVGTEGDVVVVGDWDCDGTATPAVLRAGSGRLHLFDTWAVEETTSVTAAPGPTVPRDAVAVEPRGCGRATVRTAGGQVLALTTASDR